MHAVPNHVVSVTPAKMPPAEPSAVNSFSEVVNELVHIACFVPEGGLG
jgi:hypothetical protein